MTQLIVVGDQCMTPEEYAAYRRRLDYNAAWRKARRAADPDFRERENAYKRERHRRTYRRRVGYLHDLACTGPTRKTGCVCQRIPCYNKPPQERAA